MANTAHDPVADAAKREKRDRVKYFERATDRIRVALCAPGGGGLALWRLLYAAKEYAKGKQCVGYYGEDGAERLMAAIESEIPADR